MKTTFQVQNLKCGGCANTISSKLSELEGIQSVIVEKENSSVSFEHQYPDDISLVKKALRKMGYPTVDDENGILLKAKSYMSCASGKLA
ncbi:MULTISPECIES: heavy-metal-associated domain-containing protein [Flagellimonas]|uniref:Heavy-metal-associated domain-containing protein n=1 Tax=Flagellimonas hadalis TaxID=2597517 RepID=A0A5N5J5I4_9FLAO|nr:heavy metal-associated domain-containing protein [Allomuricauda hadalis]KAB5490926.1 heavy-metal-associated domain-containing protein [Allomuricauda hadalis]RUA16111.1 MAG: heavy metal transporter [Flavobacteriia bacterium]